MPTAASAPIRRVYVEKRPGFDVEARRLREELAEFLGAQVPAIAALAAVRVLHRYDVVHLGPDEFDRATRLVFAEPQCDFFFVQAEVPATFPGDASFAIEYLPGQYDQRADSAEQCAELAVGVKPLVRSARVYVLRPGPGAPLSDADVRAVKGYLLNPVDSRDAGLSLPETLEPPIAEPLSVARLNGFRIAGDVALEALGKAYGLAMGLPDLRFCREYFISMGRDPSLAELRVLDTYWSDHCRHSTFTTVLETIETADGPDAPALERALDLYEKARIEAYGKAGSLKRPRTLMDAATIGAKVLRKRGLVEDLEVSEEINACSVRVKAEFDDGSTEPWLLMFKNETHNHPTEIEPFGGAATCLGGAIRDPLSGRAFVHQAMRVTGGADPRAPLSATLPGKLPQLKIAREAAAGYASYGNQIGLATGQVSEFYHPGFLAKRMELGAVIGAVPEAWVRREEPVPGDVVLLVGGKTGRDGIGGATGSSKAHTDESVGSAGAEVQKGNAVEERKIQRLFRDPAATRLIKRCNDFGAGGVSVAVGELARGLDVELDAVPKKYEGLDGTELAISESQERMAVVVAPGDVAVFTTLAAAENLSAVPVARVTEEDRLRMTWRGDVVVDLERVFLDSNGASRSAAVRMAPTATLGSEAVTSEAGASSISASVSLDNLERELRSLRSGSRRGLQERFDGSIGAASVLFPWGGAEQGTPECGMAAALPALGKDARTASLMAFGYDPALASESPYRGAKAAVLEALAKIACLGGDPFAARLSLQEYFERTSSPEAWGKPLQALLGALEAQLELGVPAVGGKDSMSGSYRDPSSGIELAVPPTLVAFAAGTAPVSSVRSGALTGAVGAPVVLFFLPALRADGQAADPAFAAFRANVAALRELAAADLVRAAYPVAPGGVAVSLALMAFGNGTGVEYKASAASLTAPAGSFLAELDPAAFESRSADTRAALDSGAFWAVVASTVEDPVFRQVSGFPAADEDPSAAEVAETPLAVLRRAFEYPLARVYPQTAAGATVAEPADGGVLELPSWTKGCAPRVSKAGAGKPLVVLPVFPGTNCEWDMERAFRKAGARTKLVMFRNRTREDALSSTAELAAAVAEAQIVALSGGFSAGDEPDGSGKFIANAFRSPAVASELQDLLERRDGLMIGVCNGFQALIKLGLVPFGSYRDADETLPTLTFNAIGRHVSRVVRTRVMSNRSPWLGLDPVGTIHSIPVSHGEGRVAIDENLARRLFADGRVPFCYVDGEGRPTMAEPDNPNGSAFAIEGITSPDGRVLGKMGHSERAGDGILKNIPGNKHQRIFEAGVAYFG